MRAFVLVLFFFVVQTSHGKNLIEIKKFGDNPGELKGYKYITSLDSRRLVVVLHGCSQSTTGFDNETGWLKVAKSKGLNLLFIEQQTSNNGFSCFNWFESKDNRRNSGEVLSIYNMIKYIQKTYNVRETYVTGLSAGAIMANTLLATHPELFKAGIIAAGVYHGCANNSSDAFACMYGYRPSPSQDSLVNYVHESSGEFNGRWPKVIIVQGLKDTVVHPKNASMLLNQWSGVHKIDQNADFEEQVGSKVNLKIYKDNRGRSKVFTVDIEGMGHGYPIDSTNDCGEAASYILDVDYCLAQRSLELLGVQ